MARAGCALAAQRVAVARKEARETLYWLRLLTACAVVLPEEISTEVDEAEQIYAILTAILVNAKSSPRRG